MYVTAGKLAVLEKLLAKWNLEQENVGDLYSRQA
jgi:hypothetical protein